MRSLAISMTVRFVLYCLAGGAFGLMLGYPLLFALIGGLIWVGIQIHNISRLVWWSKHELDQPPPEIDGPLGEVAYKFNRYQRAQVKRRSRLNSVISRFQESASAMSDAIVIIDSQGAVEWWNDSGRTLIGLVEADRGHSILNLIRHPDFVQFYRSSEQKTPLTIPSSEGNKILEYRIHRFGQGDRVLVARDITEVHRLEQMRRDFVANASHEIRTPLTVIHGYLEMLQDQELKPLFRRAIDSMYNQSSRMETLISDLLELSRLENNNRTKDIKPIGVANLLDRLVTEARTLSGEKAHKIECSFDPSIELLGNAKELQSAFSNLVFNAIRYTPAGGQVRLKFEKTEQGARFSVTDTGVGIEAKHLPRLTERFYRVDAGRSREDGGTGLGLAIVKHALNRHGAHLEIESTLGLGSCFSCVFPDTCISVVPADDPPQKAAQTSAQSRQAEHTDQSTSVSHQ